MKNNPITFLRHLAAPLLLLGATSLFAATGTQTLRNDKLQISIDKDGRLVSLRNLETGRDYAGNDFLWRLYYDTQKAKEIEVLPERQTPHVSSDGKTITLTYNELKATDFSTREEVTLHMRLRLDLSLEGDLIRCASTIENNEPHTIIREFHYPLVGNMPLPEDHKLLLTPHRRAALRRSEGYHPAQQQLLTLQDPGTEIPTDGRQISHADRDGRDRRLHGLELLRLCRRARGALFREPRSAVPGHGTRTAPLPRRGGELHPSGVGILQISPLLRG